MTDKKAKTGTDRKAAQRERDRTQGVKRVELRLPPSLAEKLEEACRVRGGLSGPYEIQEYLETLIEQDHERLMVHLEQLKQAPCQKCGKALPEGCGGVHKWERDCLHTIDERQLLLREPQRFTIEQLTKEA